MLVVTGSAAEKVAEFIVLSAEPAGRVVLLEAAHTSDPSLDPAMVLFKSIVIRHNSSDATSGFVKSWAAGSYPRGTGTGASGARDLFVIPTIGFKLLYGLVILRLERRRLV